MKYLAAYTLLVLAGNNSPSTVLSISLRRSRCYQPSQGGRNWSRQGFSWQSCLSPEGKEPRGGYCRRIKEDPKSFIRRRLSPRSSSLSYCCTCRIEGRAKESWEGPRTRRGRWYGRIIWLLTAKYNSTIFKRSM